MDNINEELAAVAADVPNSEHKPGDMALEYTLQNFNALVAATTALQTELSGAAERERLLQRNLDDLRESNKAITFDNNRLHTDFAARCKEYDAMLKLKDGELGDLRTKRNFHRDKANELQRKLDRQSGYLDRVLDYEAALDAPKTVTTPAPQPEVGPDFSEIPRARYPQDGDDSHWIAGAVGRIDSYASSRPRRR